MIGRPDFTYHSTNFHMKIQLINGQFSPQDALQILTKMTHAKVSYHEQQIKTSDLEEDIKSREKRIRDLQNNLQEVRAYIAANGQGGIQIQAEVILTATTQSELTKSVGLSGV